eukprot:2139387-Rhodomonas_salina.2
MSGTRLAYAATSYASPVRCPRSLRDISLSACRYCLHIRYEMFGTHVACAATRFHVVNVEDVMYDLVSPWRCDPRFSVAGTECLRVAS